MKPGIGKNGWDRIVEYVSKEGFAIGPGAVFMPKHPKGYKRAKADWEAWQADTRVLHAPSPFPILLPDGKSTISEPKGYQRKYIYILYGDPDRGKSYWRKKSIKPGVAFRPSLPNYPMEGYSGQQVIVYDDFDFPSLVKYGHDPTQLLIANGEYEYEKVSVGAARFQQYFYPANQQRIVILLMNTPLPDWVYSERVQSRVVLMFNFDTDLLPPRSP